MKLYFNVETDFTIQDERGAKLTVEEAREAVEGGQVDGGNRHFFRLITDFQYDVTKARAHFASAEATGNGTKPRGRN